MLIRLSILLALLTAPLALAKDPVTLQAAEQRVEYETEKLHSAGFDSATILEKAKAGDAEYIKAADAQLKIQQEAYDDLVKAQLENLLEKAEVVAAAVNADPALGPAERKSIQRLGKFADQFRRSADLFGTGHDVRRKTAFQRYFAEFKKLSDRLEKKPLGARLMAKMREIVQVVKMTLAALPEAPGFLKKLYFPGEDQSMITRTLYRSLRGFGKRAGYEVSVTGKEKIPAVEGKTLNIFAPTHRLAVNDAVIMAEVAPKDSLLFMAPRNFLPGVLAGQIESVPGFVAVGRGQEPVEVAMLALKKSGAHSIFIYPEGSLPAGIMENSPVRENFSLKLIAGLRAAGYEVNIVPISYQNSARLLNGSTTEPGAKALKAEVHEAIRDKVIGEWEKYDPTFLNRYLRSVHMEGLETNDQQLMGMLRPSALVPELKKYLGACPGYFSLLNN